MRQKLVQIWLSDALLFQLMYIYALRITGSGESHFVHTQGQTYYNIMLFYY